MSHQMLDKVALVTGASSGIGRAIARSLARRRLRLIYLVARRVERLEALARELGPGAEVLRCDLSSASEREAMLAGLDRVDVLVNSAGLAATSLFCDRASSDPLSLTQVVQVNCEAPVHLSSTLLPAMIARGQGWILNVGSVAGEFPTPTAAVYGGSKAFLNRFTEALQAELGGTGVHVHLLAPGPVDTELFGSGGLSFPPPPPLYVSEEQVAEEGVQALLEHRRRHTPGFLARCMGAVMGRVPRDLYLSVSSVSIQRKRR